MEASGQAQVQPPKENVPRKPRPRNKRGQMLPAVPDVALRDAEVTRLVASGKKYEDVVALGIPGIGSVSRVSEAVKRCRKAVLEKAGEEFLAEELEILDVARAKLLETLASPGVRISPSGHVVVSKLTGEPYPDTEKLISAADAIRKNVETKAKMLGLNAAKMTVTASVDLDGELQRSYTEISGYLVQLQQENTRLRALIPEDQDVVDAVLVEEPATLPVAAITEPPQSPGEPPG